MKRGWAVRRAGFWNPADAADFVVLDAGDRYRRRITFKGERGTEFLLDLDEAVALRDGDGIMLDDGGIVLVAGQAESLAEVGSEALVRSLLCSSTRPRASRYRRMWLATRTRIPMM